MPRPPFSIVCYSISLSRPFSHFPLFPLMKAGLFRDKSLCPSFRQTPGFGRGPESFSPLLAVYPTGDSCVFLFFYRASCRRPSVFFRSAASCKIATTVRLCFPGSVRSVFFLSGVSDPFLRLLSPYFPHYVLFGREGGISFHGATVGKACLHGGGLGEGRPSGDFRFPQWGKADGSKSGLPCGPPAQIRRPRRAPKQKSKQNKNPRRAPPGLLSSMGHWPADPPPPKGCGSQVPSQAVNSCTLPPTFPLVHQRGCNKQLRCAPQIC